MEGLSVPIIAGQVLLRILKGKIHWRNTLQQLERTGPKSLGVCLLTSTFVRLAFTIQFDTLRVLGADPVDYLITPRVIASCLALPFLTLMCFAVGMASSDLLSDAVYGISINIIMDSARRALRPWDIVSAMIKSQVFGAIISVISCSWGVDHYGRC